LKFSGSISATGSDETALDNAAAEKLLARCDALSACTDRDGTIERTFLSPAMERCNRLVSEWMESAGMHVAIDSAGNLRGLYEGNVAEAPRLILASHLDTVPNAGKYDGILGVLLSIALVDWLQGKRLPFAIEIIGFSDEEGVRFGFPFIGSRAVAGELAASHLQLLDADGVSLGAALDAFAILHGTVMPPRLNPRSCAYLEFHIEQGPVLEDRHQALGVVEAIAGQSRATLTFRGCAGHAGTTPMALRRDAMTAAAEWILFVESTAMATPGLVASTGRIICEPGASNIIPGFVRCSLDLRSANNGLRQSSLHSILDAALTIADRRRVRVSHTIDADQATVALDASLTLLAQQAVKQTQPEAAPMISGAGHDAMILAPHLPAAMIFLRSPGGLSHHPEEAVLAGDVSAALRAGIYFLQNFAQWIQIEGRA
jgi:allantoate deiminase